MKNGFTTLPHTRHSKCEICGSAINPVDLVHMTDSEYTICRSIDCQRVISQQSSMSPLLFKSHLEFNKKLIRQRRKKETERKRHKEKIIQREEQENLEILHSILEKHPELSADSVHSVVIPAGYSKLLPAEPERMDKYIEHIKSIVTEAGKYKNAAEVVYDEHHAAHEKMMLIEQKLDETPALRTISDRLCTLCKGGCCASGKEHAYLSVITMRRFMDDNPHLSVEDITELYLSSLAGKRIQNSCINHTETGCALPRELRSDICNGYYCDSVKAYQKKIEGIDDPGVTLVVQRSCTNWNRFDRGVTNEVTNVVLLTVAGYSDDGESGPSV